MEVHWSALMLAPHMLKLCNSVCETAAPLTQFPHYQFARRAQLPACLCFTKLSFTKRARCAPAWAEYSARGKDGKKLALIGTPLRAHAHNCNRAYSRSLMGFCLHAHMGRLGFQCMQHSRPCPHCLAPW